MDMSPETKRNLAVSSVVAVFALLLGIGYDQWNKSQPVQPQFVPNRQDRSIDVEIANPSTRTYRGIRATFSVKKKYQPPHAVGAPIAVDQIVFTDSDIDQRYGVYTKSISNIKLPANDESTLRVYIIKPEHNNWLYVGRLTIEYGDRDKPQTFTNPNHQVFVTDRVPEVYEP